MSVSTGAKLTQSIFSFWFAKSEFGGSDAVVFISYHVGCHGMSVTRNAVVLKGMWKFCTDESSTTIIVGGAGR